jgi:hypothetical protein
VRSAAVAGLLALFLTAAASGAPPRGDARGLALLTRVHRAYVGVPATFAIDRRSLLIQSITVRAQGVRIVEHVRTLRAAPKPLVPRPRC